MGTHFHKIVGFSAVCSCSWFCSILFNAQVGAFAQRSSYSGQPQAAFFLILIGWPCRHGSMYVPRSAYNDVNSPKIGFPCHFRWYQSQKKSLHCIILYSNTFTEVRQACQIRCQPHFIGKRSTRQQNWQRLRWLYCIGKLKFFLLLKRIVGHQWFLAADLNNQHVVMNKFFTKKNNVTMITVLGLGDRVFWWTNISSFWRVLEILNIL